MFGLENLGINLATLRPGAVPALHHRYLRQDEFIYVMAGEPTLLIDTRKALCGSPGPT
jgi:uncharacterized cupin superfamily protein